MMRCVVCISLSWTIAGCAGLHQILAPRPQKEEAKARWSLMRAKVKLQLAENEFKAGHLDESLKSLDEVLQLEPENPRAVLLLARVRLESGQLNAARNAVAEALLLMPDSAEPSYVAGMIAERGENWPEAIRFYSRASDMSPDDPDYLAAQIEAMMALGQSGDALALLDSRMSRFDNEPRLRYLAAEIHRSMGQSASAARELRMAARNDSGSVILQDDLGETLSASGRDAEAVGLLEARQREEDRRAAGGADIDNAASTQRRLTMARSYLRLGRTDDARQVLHDLLEAAPEQSAAWLLLARVETDSERWAAACDAAEHAARLMPDHDAAHLMCAYARLRKENPRGAAEAARRAIALNPQNAIAYCTLGQALEALDDPERARETYTRALTVDPECALARKLLEQSTQNAAPTALRRDDARSALRMPAHEHVPDDPENGAP